MKSTILCALALVLCATLVAAKPSPSEKDCAKKAKVCKEPFSKAVKAGMCDFAATETCLESALKTPCPVLLTKILIKVAEKKASCLGVATSGGLVLPGGDASGSKSGGASVKSGSKSGGASAGSKEKPSSAEVLCISKAKTCQAKYTECIEAGTCEFSPATTCVESALATDCPALLVEVLATITAAKEKCDANDGEIIPEDLLGPEASSKENSGGSSIKLGSGGKSGGASTGSKEKPSSAEVLCIEKATSCQATFTECIEAGTCVFTPAKTCVESALATDCPALLAKVLAIITAVKVKCLANGGVIEPIDLLNPEASSKGSGGSSMKLGSGGKSGGSSEAVLCAIDVVLPKIEACMSAVETHSSYCANYESVAECVAEAIAGCDKMKTLGEKILASAKEVFEKTCKGDSCENLFDRISALTTCTEVFVENVQTDPCAAYKTMHACALEQFAGCKYLKEKHKVTYEAFKENYSTECMGGASVGSKEASPKFTVRSAHKAELSSLQQFQRMIDDAGMKKSVRKSQGKLTLADKLKKMIRALGGH